MHRLNIIKQSCLTIFILCQILHSTTSSCKDQVCDSLDDLGVHTDASWHYVHFASWFPARKQYLAANSFQETSELNYITITKMVNGISPNAFNGVLRLMAVVLQDNILPYLPRQLFQKNPLMQKIVIKNCLLQEITVGLFRNLPLLSHISVEGNRIGKLEKKMFPRSLIQLILRKNRINFIEEDTFHGMKKLEILDLSENKLHKFEIAKFMVHTPRLEELNLGSNALQTISPLPTLPNLKYLFFDNNSITTVANGSFVDCYNLEILKLSLNNLEALQSNYFSEIGLPKLHKLYINHNKITCVNIEILQLFPNMKVAWFAMNPLNCSCYRNMISYMARNQIKMLYNYDEEWNDYKKCAKR